MDSPNFNKKEALETHKQLLLEKKIRLEKIIQSVDKTISSMEGEFKMNKKEVLGAFDMTEIEEHQKKYSEEVKINMETPLLIRKVMKKLLNIQKKIGII